MRPLAILLSLVVLIVFNSTARERAAPGPVLVLPLAHTSSNANLDWLGTAFAEVITDFLRSRAIPAIRRQELIEASRELGLRSQVPLALATGLKVAEVVEAK